MKKFLILTIILLVIQSSYSQQPEIQFDRISVQQGLQDHSINSIMQDKHGFIWIGSNNGFYKYDGYDFAFYKEHPGCKTCPPFKSVYKIQEDELGLLWIISDAGITIFDPQKERSVLLYPSTIDSLNANYNLNPVLLRDSGGRIWASSMSGLIRISFRDNLKKPLSTDIIFATKAKNIYKRELIQLPAGQDRKNNPVKTIMEDKEGNIWVGCISGLFFLKKSISTFIRLDEALESETHQGLSDIKAIVQVNSNSYLVAAGSDLWLVKNARMALHGPVTDISSLQFFREQVVGDQIPMSLLADRQKNILLGTQKEIYKINLDSLTNKASYDLIKSNVTDPEDKGYNKIIQDIFEDRTGVIWIAQSYYGISKFNLIQSQFISYKNLIISNFKSADINPIYKDKRGNLWIGTFGGGLYKIQSGNIKVTCYDSGIRKNNIICMQGDNLGKFWIGLSPGFLEFNSDNGKFNDPLSDNRVADNLRGSVVWDLLKDGDRLFIGTLCGLFILDIPKNKLYQFSLIKNDSVNDNYNSIRSLIKLRNGSILTGTPGQGVNKINFNEYNGSITLHTVVTNEVLIKNGISLTRRYRLYEDSNGLLWILDFSGLHSIDLRTAIVKNYKLFEKIDFPEAWSLIGKIGHIDHPRSFS
jgi:ligand-binding sensor domain-containing protein